MSDIVERLRNLDTATCEDAADEIERLRGGMLKMASTMSTQVETIERLRAALRFYAEGEWSDGYPGGVKIDDNTLDFGDIARAALEEK